MGSDLAPRTRRTIDRRTVLKLAGVSGPGAFAGCMHYDDVDDVEDVGGNGNDDSLLGNYPPEGDTVTYGFCGPLSGPLSNEGEDQQNGFELAVHHLNTGGGAVEHWDQLSGEGVLDYGVEAVSEDSGMEADWARNAIEGMIEQDDIQFWTGGMMAPVAMEGQTIAQEYKIPYVGSNSTAADISGSTCSRYYFHSGYHAETIALAAGEALPEEFGADSSLFHVYLDYSYGQSNYDAQHRRLVEEGPWEDAGSHGVDYDVPNHTEAINALEDSGADVLHLASYGELAAGMLQEMESTDILGDYEVYIPFLSDMTIEPLGDLVDQVYGFEPWNPDLAEEDAAAAAFVEAYEEQFGRTPSQSAWLTYDAVLHYSAAVEQNGDFYPPDVIRQLEGFSWNQGYGQPLEYRECDHTAERPIYLVQGSDSGYSTEVVTASDPVINDCTEYPSSDCFMDDNEYGDE